MRLWMPLSRVIPLALLAFGIFFVTLSYWLDIREIDRNILQQQKLLASHSGNQLSMLLRDPIASGDEASAKRLLQSIATLPDLRWAAVVDDQGRILFNTDYQLQGLHIGRVAGSLLLPPLQIARDTQSGITGVSDDRETVWSIYPMRLALQPGGLQTEAVGALILTFNHALPRMIEYRRALTQALPPTVGSLLFAFLLWAYLHSALVRRIGRLTDSMQKRRDQQFELDVIQGEDEVAQLSRHFSELTTELSGQNRQLHALFDGGFQFTGLLDPSGILKDANNRALAFIGCELEDVTGKPFWETPWWTVDHQQQQTLIGDITAVAAGKTVLREVQHPSFEGKMHIFNFSLRPIYDDNNEVRLLLAEAYDITQLKEEERRSLRLNSFYTTLSDTNLAIIRSGSEAELLAEVCSIIARNQYILGVWCGLINSDNGTLETIAAEGRTRDNLKDITLPLDLLDGNRDGPVAKVVNSGEPFICNDFLDDGALVDWHENAWEIGCNATASFPLFCGDEFVGCFTLFASRAGFFEDDLVALLAQMTRDISHALKSLQRQARLRLSAKVFENSHEAIVIMDTNHSILDCNPAFSEVTGYSAEEVVGKPSLLLKSGQYHRLFYDKIWATVDKRGFWQGELWNRRKDGELFPSLVSISAIYDEQGNITHYISISADTSEHKEAEERINYLAYYDPLTNLPNRSLIAEHAEQALTEAAEQMREVAVVYLDLDHFKTVNDSLGHQVGDNLLQQVVARTSALLGDSDNFGRLAGDEFLITLGNTDATRSASLVHKILKEFEVPFNIDGQLLNLQASAGIAMFPKDGVTFGELHKHADAAMHKAKELGRNRYHFFTPELNAAATQRLVLENQLRIAMRLGQLSLYYQPQVDIASGATTGAEVLLRWFHPRLGEVPPGLFIAIAEDTSLIVDIGNWVLLEACRQFMRWREMGLNIPRIAVNVSTRQFGLGDLAATIREVLEHTGMPAEALEIEITESLLSADIERTLQTMRDIHQLGVCIAVDDFGTGYSSLSYLKQFPLSKLKIDQSFVSDLNSDLGDRAIAAAVVTLGHSLSLTVTAEGVETLEQLEELKLLGCDHAQGYLFSRPMPVDAMTEYVRAQTLLSCPSQ